jgi:hypothetical protein
MKVQVLKNFVDKETGKFKTEGTEIELSLSRARELSEKGFVKMLEEVKEEKSVKTQIKKSSEKKDTKKTIAKK